jgi:hypothetical protein
MIIVEKPKLRFLLAGRPIDIHVEHEYRRGRTYAVGVRHNHPATCRVAIIHCHPLDTGWTIRIQRLSGDIVRLMTRSGYVEAPVELDPDDPDVLIGGRLTEPELIDQTTLERYAIEGYAGHARRKTLELRRQHVRSATIRLREAERREDWPEYRKALDDLQAIERQIA